MAIVGRPNVGKSALFNRLVGGDPAIVHDRPGVTRDRHYAEAHVGGRRVNLVDTGGFDPESEDPMQAGITRHVVAAIEEADVVICVFDGTLPPTASDRSAADLLRRSDKPVVYVANKTDTEQHEQGIGPLFELGLPAVIPVSALHGRGTGALGVAVREALPDPSEPVSLADEGPRVALVGRPNAGKSSLFNRLAGEERSLVDPRPGTTRDPIDRFIEYRKHRLTVVDTAGVRRRPKVERGVELVSVLRAIRAVERANVAVLLCDASESVADQDQRLAALCIDRRRGLVVGLNKMDTLRARARKEAVAQAREALSFATFAPIVPISAKTGENLDQLLSTVVRAAESMRTRVPTGELNRFFEEVLSRQPPPTHRGRAPRIYYVTQAETSPPLFVAMSNEPAHIKPSYQRFVINQIRKAFGFEGVPISVQYRPKRAR